MGSPVARSVTKPGVSSRTENLPLCPRWDTHRALPSCLQWGHQAHELGEGSDEGLPEARGQRSVSWPPQAKKEPREMRAGRPDRGTPRLALRVHTETLPAGKKDRQWGRSIHVVTYRAVMDQRVELWHSAASLLKGSLFAGMSPE